MVILSIYSDTHLYRLNTARGRRPHLLVIIFTGYYIRNTAIFVRSMPINIAHSLTSRIYASPRRKSDAEVHKIIRTASNSSN